MYRALRPLLFALPPELSQALALRGLRAYGALPTLAGYAPAGSEPVRLMGLSFANRIGVAAGLDKNGVAVAGLARLGFGFVEVGTVTPRAQPGNPRPRVFRLTEDQALINRLGFNSAGVERLAASLTEARGRVSVPIGVNIGKNRATPAEAAADDYLANLAAVHRLADYVVVNLSSPNTPGLRKLQEAATARALLSTLIAERDRLTREAGGRSLPVLVKLAPDLAPEALEATAAAVLEAGGDGFVAVNTTQTRPKLRSKFAGQDGGLSGRPLLPMAVATVRRLRATSGDKPALIGVGGIATADDVRAMLDAGADLLQVYTALIFRGPSLVRRLIRACEP